MRILGLTNLFPNPFQPTRAPFNRDKFLGLSELHAVRVIAPILWTQELTARRRGAMPLSYERQSQQNGIVVEHPSYWYSPGILRAYYGNFFQKSVRQTFFRVVNEFRPDVVLATWAYPDGWAAVRLGRAAGLPVVIQTHGSDVLLVDDFSARRARTIEALQSACGVITVSQNLANRVVEMGVRPENVRVIYNGVHSEVFHPGDRDAARRELQLTPNRPLVLFVGNLEEIKGVHVLLEACQILLRERMPVELALIGTGSWRKRLERQAGRLGIMGSVRFIGGLSQRELPSWYRAADLLAVPSLSEGVPNVLLEAIACGTPYVASDVGGIPEIAHLGTGRLVAPRRPEQAANAIRQILAMPRQYTVGQVRNQRIVAQEMSEFLEIALARFRDDSIVPADAKPRKAVAGPF
jgi:glycosyltransferase involved in cell wall biosynthesis